MRDFIHFIRVTLAFIVGGKEMERRMAREIELADMKAFREGYSKGHDNGVKHGRRHLA